MSSYLGFDSYPTYKSRFPILCKFILAIVNDNKSKTKKTLVKVRILQDTSLP